MRKRRVVGMTQGGMIGVCCGSALLLFAAPRFSRGAPTGGPAPTADIGQELRQIERRSVEASVPAREAPRPVIETPAHVPPEPRAADDGAEPSNGYPIRELEVRGDVEFLKTRYMQPAGAGGKAPRQSLYDALEQAIVGKRLLPRQVASIATEFERRIWRYASAEHNRYLMARLTPVPTDYSQGRVILEFDQGRIGNMTFKESPADVSSLGDWVSRMLRRERPLEVPGPFRGTYFSERQLRRKLSGLKAEQPFDYLEFYRIIYGVNAHPDLQVDSKLALRRDETRDPARRYVDFDFTVQETLPLHMVLSVGNSGTEVTGDWRPNLTLQYLNLTRNDDILTLNLGPLGDVDSFAGSYYFPQTWARGGGLTLFGGYSDLDAEEVVPLVGVKGQGWFSGIQQSYRLLEDNRHSVGLSAGLTYRLMEDQLIIRGETPGADLPLEERKVELMPLSLAQTYASTRPLIGGGRLFVTLQQVLHFGGMPGVSEDAEIEKLRVGASSDYFILRCQGAWIQPLAGLNPWRAVAPPARKTEQQLQDETRRRWLRPAEALVFVKVDGQLADGPVVPAEQKTLGGMDTVRGFPERIAMGDNGISGTLEIRSPMWRNLVPNLFARQTAKPAAANLPRRWDGWQGVVFVDGGHVQIDDALEGERDSHSLLSAGAGFRFMFTEHAQLRFDWGFPLAGRDQLNEPGAVEEVKSSGRFHLSAQVQF